MCKTTSMGIERTMSDLVNKDNTKRINGLIKFLVEDFHVHEINVKGEVLKIGKYIPLEKISRVMEHRNRINTGEDFLRKYDSSFVFPEHLLTSGDVSRLHVLLGTLQNFLLRTKVIEDEKADSGTDINNIYSLHICKGSDDMKAVRTSLHNWIRENLPFLESKSLNVKSVRNSDDMTKYLEPYSDEFSALEDSYNLVHISPKPVCSKNIRSKWANYKCPEDSQSDTSVVLKEVESDSRPADYSPTETLEDLIKEVDCTDYSTWSSNHKDNVKLRKYLHFTMLKMNRDTSEVVNMLCKCGKRASFDVFTAGNKDRRAVTVQRMCMRRGDIAEIFETMSKKGWFKDVYLSDFSYSDDRLYLGELSGNFFKVVVRGLEVPSTDSDPGHIDGNKKLENIIGARVDSLRKYGFINYFGLQRFGSMLVGTHVVGAAMIKQDYESAVRLILGDVESAQVFPWFKNYISGKSLDNLGTAEAGAAESVTNTSHRESLDPERKYKRAVDYYLKDNDAKSALKFLPNHLYIEKSLLKALDEDLAFDKCLCRIPKNILSIYVHAAQSLVFNKAINERLSKFGYDPVVGDLVSTGSLDDEEKTSNKRENIIEISDENEAKRYSIDQVILPLPGDDVQYPRNMVDVYKKISLEEFGIPLEMFSTHIGKSKCIVSVGGSYRFIVVKPSNVSYKLVGALKNPFEILVPPPISLTDVDQTLEEGSKYSEKMNRISKELENKEAVILTCSLPKSSYITMAIREVFTDKTIEKL